MQRVASNHGPWRLFDAPQTRAIEAHALSAHPPGALMQRAGESVARLALAVAPHAQRVVVLVGPGNNGGDGLVAATALLAAGKSVQAHLVASTARRPDDAEQALQEARAAGVPITSGLPDDSAAPGLIIDALLGLGGSRPLQGAFADAVAWTQGRSAVRLAVDLPTGLDGDTGQVRGEQAFRAHHTLALLTLKPGLFTAHGRDHAGQVWLDTLGVETTGREAAGPAAIVPSMADLFRPWAARPHASHKGSNGDVAVVGGDAGMAGALWLAAQAALAAGAGRVYAAPLDEATPLLLPTRPELMGRHRWWESDPSVLSATTVVCGCGGGNCIAAVLPRLLAHVRQLVLDADALNAMAGDAMLAALLEARARRGATTVLTPHPLEAARLLGCGTAEVQDDRLRAARTLAERFGCVVVLKGSGSIIGRPGAPPAINLSGDARLASAGTGDVLAGWIGGTWGSPALKGLGVDEQAWAAALSSTWLHGQAADLSAAAPTMRAGDLVEAMRAALPR